jgi:hypothetical protein
MTLLRFAIKPSSLRRLLMLKKLEKSPMNAYAMLMDWHLRDKGVLQEKETLKDAGSANFIGCATLINRLAKRYNMTDKRPIKKVVRLPSSKEVVRIPIFDAEDCIVELLTNPLLKDEDFDFFDDNPLAPPANLDYIGNNITGSAYQSSFGWFILLISGEKVTPVCCPRSWVSFLVYFLNMLCSKSVKIP